MRNYFLSNKIITWYWDNHRCWECDELLVRHSHKNIPSHSFNVNHITRGLGPHVPLCSSQWGSKTVEFAGDVLFDLRSDKLYGGYSEYPFAERNEFLHEIHSTSQVDTAVTISAASRKKSCYWKKGEFQRFSEWCGYKVAVCLPLAKDLSSRFFDSLLAGQIPIVPEDCIDLNKVVPPDIQRRLGVVRFKGYSIESLFEAYQLALGIFNDQGTEGVLARHYYIKQNHLLIHRLRELRSFFLD
ncbi:MAG: hypothetical protein AAGH46_08940 [Bacteroidota bacterium]